MNGELGTILVVEDDTALRRSVKTPLSILGFQVCEASTGEEALMLAHADQFETILLDVNMPGIGGIETCKRLRCAFTKLPIIMLTVRDDEDDKVAVDLELPKLTFQVIRRTIGSLAQKKGTVKDVQGVMRHSRAATTVDVYMQEIPEGVRATVTSINDELRGVFACSS